MLQIMSAPSSHPASRSEPVARVLRRALAIAVALLLARAGDAAAHAGHQHTVMGTVVSVDASHVVVAPQEGGEVSVELSPDTHFWSGKTAASVADVVPGSRVVVKYHERGEKKQSDEVLLPAAAKPTPGPEKNP